MMVGKGFVQIVEYILFNNKVFPYLLEQHGCGSTIDLITGKFLQKSLDS
jgi:hypothetical protein